ncbi:MAG: UPF0262 family protein [Pseudomonadota bacterium]
MTRLSEIILDTDEDRGLSPIAEQERRTAIFDLLEENSFVPVSGTRGPFKLVLKQDASRLLFDLSTRRSQEEFYITLGTLRQIVKDYEQICASYYEAVKSEAPTTIETLDEARRGIHQEGASTLKSKLQDHVDVDEATARRLFTLVCAMIADK